jgi:hypothetical protein
VFHVFLKFSFTGLFLPECAGKSSRESPPSGH